MLMEEWEMPLHRPPFMQLHTVAKEGWWLIPFPWTTQPPAVVVHLLSQVSPRVHQLTSAVTRVELLTVHGVHHPFIKEPLKTRMCATT